MPTRLGQNFLKDKSVVSKIIEAADLSFDDVVLEVGPGKGVLTEELAKHCKKVIAIELDKKLIETYGNLLKLHENIELVEGDVLKINLPNILENYKLQTTNYKLVANIPYYITSPIIRLFLETKYPPKEMILMVQKEVAERICASPREIPTYSRDAKRISRGKPGEMSILAVSVQYYAKPEILFSVSKNCFEPVPEVDSAVIKLSGVSFQVSAKEAKNFFRTVRAGFSAKRKTLVNNLANSFHLDKNEVEEKIISLGFNPLVRAQELSVEGWKTVTKTFQ